jgi:pyruvate/2-oxoglutarate/acetoin dehydrogenase E1 component
VVRAAVGAGGRFSAIHSQNPATWLQGVPGLKIACPAFPADVYGMLKSAIRDDNPVLFLEHKRLYSFKGEDQTEELIPLGKASVVRDGQDLTIVSIMKGVHDALAAATELAADGLEAEVIDLRSLRPVDLNTVLASVAKTNRLLVVEEGPVVGGWAAGLIGTVTNAALEDLDDAWLIATPDTPTPYSPPLEDAFLPSADGIVQSVRERLGAGVATSA